MSVPWVSYDIERLLQNLPDYVTGVSRAENMSKTDLVTDIPFQHEKEFLRFITQFVISTDSTATSQSHVSPMRWVCIPNECLQHMDSTSTVVQAYADNEEGDDPSCRWCLVPYF